MKKFLVFFLVLSLTAGFAAADDEDADDDKSIGLTVGLEFGITDANRPNGVEEIYPYIEASVEYENSFFEDVLSVYAGLAYDFGFTKEENDNGKEVFPNGLSIDLSVGYNLSLGYASTLSFIVENENYIEFAPALKDKVFGVVKPGIKFNYSDDKAGDFYAQLDVPIAYLLYGEEKNNFYIGTDITLGWASTFGLGIEAGGYILFSPKDEIGFTGISLIFSYERKSIYTEIETTIPIKNLKYGDLYSYFDPSAGPGVSITPMFQYTFKFGLSIYASLTLDGIGVKGNEMGITPAIGVAYSF